MGIMRKLHDVMGITCSKLKNIPGAPDKWNCSVTMREGRLGIKTTDISVHEIDIRRDIFEVRSSSIHDTITIAFAEPRDLEIIDIFDKKRLVNSEKKYATEKLFKGGEEG